MIKFYSISDNSFDTRGFPWISEITKGITMLPPCEKCGGRRFYPSGDISVIFEPDKGTKWADVLGCGSQMLLIISEKVVAAWSKENIGEIPLHRVKLQKPYPKKLEGTKPPKYYWVDGEKLCGAELDLLASGFLDARYCESCGRLLYDITKTYTLQHSKICPYIFKPDSWDGKNLFTTNLSYLKFFCTDALIDCAKKYKLTNFRFTPVEEGSAIGHKGIKYL